MELGSQSWVRNEGAIYPTGLFDPREPLQLRSARSSRTDAHFPLIAAFCARYVKSAGIGTIISLALPMCAACLAVYVLLLAALWATGLPLGIGSHYLYP